MNLWAKSLGRLVLFTAALFFFSCEDEASFLGFKNSNKKFDVNYVELELASSVLRIDSVLTDNAATSSNLGPFNSVGLFNDPLMGSLRAETYLQMAPANTTKIESNAVYDSLTIQLRLNFYSYGFTGEELMKFNIHEITGDVLVDSLEKRYYYNSSIAYNPDPIGNASIIVNKARLDTLSQDTVLITGRMNSTFGMRIFNLALNDPDSKFSDRDQFTQQIKGLVVAPATSNGLLGFNALSSLSKVVLHYHRLNDENKIDTLQRSFVFSNAPLGFNPNFTNYQSDRSGTSFSSLLDPYKSFQPTSGLRVIQSNAPIITKIDLTKFYEFAESDSVENIIINSAELTIGDVRVQEGLEPHSKVVMVIMNNEDEFFTLNNSVTAQYLAPYHKFDKGRRYYVSIDEALAEATLDYNKDNAELSGFIDSFVQSVFRNMKNKSGTVNKNRVTYLGLYPYSPTIYGAVNRTVFNANSVKLKINYTQPAPVVNNNN
jgi:hypothetical protein